MTTPTLVLTPGALAAFLVGSDQPSEGLRELSARHQLAIPAGTETAVTVLLRREVHDGRLPIPEAARALHLLGQAGLQRHDPTPYQPRIWQLLNHLPPDEAACAALAEVLQADLVTLHAPATELHCTVRQLRVATASASTTVRS